MTDTTHLGLPFIEDSQAQKHVTHNEALRILDAVIQIVVEDMTRATPPPSPAEGQRHVVADAASGAWAGHDAAIATWQDGAWVFLAPKTGWRLWSVADASIFIFDGAAWQGLAPLANDVGLLGVNTTASAPNLLSVKSNAALLAAIAPADGGSGDARLQISKQAAGNTASVVFSDNYSGRAEFGLTGDDHFRLKVSPDGASWRDSFVIDKSTANVAFSGFADAAATRRQLSAAPIDALGAMSMFANGGFEGGAEASATAITLTATSTLQSVAVVDGAAAAYRGSFVAAVRQVASPFAGGRYALKYTVSSAQASLGANDELCCVLTVPGLQSAKLALGSANAQPQSLGFWFQAHRTGTYSGSIRNGARARSCPFSFTVTAADAPQWISLTGLAGDTSGTWGIDADAGMLITICLAAGTSRVGTAATWAGADYCGATGTVNGVAATSDVFFIGNVISLPGSELPDAARAAFAMKPRNETLRTDSQSLSSGQQSQARANLDLVKQSSVSDATANRVMMTGAFGWGTNSINALDLNAAIRPGVYSSRPSTNGRPPGNTYHNVLVLRIDDSVVSQIAMLGADSILNVCYMRGSNSNGASWSSWSRVYMDSNAVGAVSQSGGVPTGAIIERGSNSNGSYVKFADGTMICWNRISVSDQPINGSYGSLFLGSRSMTFPVGFASDPIVSCSEFLYSGQASWPGSILTTTSAAVLRGLDIVSRSAGTSTSIAYTAIGRWF